MERNRQEFIYKLKQHKFSDADIDAAMFAYDLSKSAHRNQMRDAGERFFEHARDTAIILLDEIGTSDINEVIALLLHDTGEDTGLFGNIKDSYQLFVRTATYRLTKTFNPFVADHVIRLTKPHVDGMYFKDKAVMMKFYISSLQEKFPTFILKMIDRLSNLRTLLLDNPEKITKQIKETREVLLPAFYESYIRWIESRDLARYSVLISKVEHELERLGKLVPVQ